MEPLQSWVETALFDPGQGAERNEVPLCRRQSLDLAERVTEALTSPPQQLADGS
jgi:hypothetical protein